MKNLRTVLWGMLLVAIGVIVGLNAFDVVKVNLFFEGWWTFLIIIPCTFDLFKSRNKTFDVIGILVGVVLLLVTRDVLTTELIRKISLPAILVVFGLYLILKNSFGGKSKEEINRLNLNRANFVNKAATFSSQNIRFDNQIVEGLDLNASFGSIECDLRNGIIQHDVVINANASFGSIDIYVPSYVNVVVSSTSFFGGVSNQTKQSAKEAPKVYINSVCFFGSVDVN